MGIYMMKCIRFLIFYGVMLSSCMAGPVVDGLLQRYDAIDSMSCSIRRETRGPSQTVRMLSRVFYQRPDRLHVQNYSPVKRRYVADGERMFYHIDGMEKGFSRPISELNADWLVSLRALPCTPMDHLLRLVGCAESACAPTDAFPVRTACVTDKAYVLLSQNALGDLVRIEFFSTPDFKKMIASYDYSDFETWEGGIRLPTSRVGQLTIDSQTVEEVFRIKNVAINKPISSQLFDAGPYFKDVLFEDDFEKITQ